MRIGSLGDIVFEASSMRMLTPNSAKFSYSSRYEDHAVQGAYEQTEFLAPSLATVALSLHLRRDFLGRDPREVMDALAGMSANGEVARLVLGGVNYGRFTIRKVDWDWLNTAPDGGPAAIDCQIELKEYAGAL